MHLTAKSQSVSTEEATRLIRISRRKSSDASSQKDRNLRILIGHVNLIETLRHEFSDVHHYEESPTRKPTSSPPASGLGRHITWSDSVRPRKSAAAAAEEEEEEEGAVDFEDDGAEDLPALALVRTRSRSADPPRPPV